MKQRCQWPGTDPLYIEYHDQEWGVPLRDDGKLFEFLLLDGAQAGLSWITILRKRETYREAFDHFDPQKMALYDDAKRAVLLANPGIVRNRLKVDAFITNARAYLELRQQGSTLGDYLWDFVDQRPIQNHWKTLSEIPASTPLSERMSKGLKKRGFRFVGPTICYAFMQAAGMVNDHLVDCFRHQHCQDLAQELFR